MKEQILFFHDNFLSKQLELFNQPFMTKQKILLLIPLLIISCLLIYTWSCIFFGDYYGASWQHLLAVGFFIIPAVMFFLHFKLSVLSTGCYLLLGTFNLLALTPWIASTSYWMQIGPLTVGTPKLQLLSLGLLVLFCALNFKTLVNIYLDYKGYKDEQASNE